MIPNNWDIFINEFKNLIKKYDKDIIDVSRGTAKEDELFDYADIPSYMKTV